VINPADFDTENIDQEIGHRIEQAFGATLGA
jgi:hypothetical protein